MSRDSTVIAFRQPEAIDDVQGVKFQNGIEVITMPAHHAA
jgi:hypothetical protein